jgi:hypothetical protein
MKQCPHCHHPIPTRRYCAGCGAELIRQLRYVQQAQARRRALLSLLRDAAAQRPGALVSGRVTPRCA